MTEAVHVCFFNRSYWPDHGATGQLLTELAEDLVRHHGFEVTVIAGFPVGAKGHVPAREVRNGVEIIRARGTTFSPRRFAGRAANYLTYFVSSSVAGVRVARPDIVVALTDPPIIGLVASVLASVRRARFVFMCQDIFPEVAALLEDFQSAAVNKALELVNRFLVWRADAVLALGETMKRRLVEGKGADPRRVHIIDNWADCAALVPGPKDNPFSRAHALRDHFVVMHAGNIGLSQNLDVVLDAAERVKAHSGIRFVFVGDGSRRAALEQAARERNLANVLFLPYQPRADMPKSYATADVFLVSLKPGLAGYIVPSKVYSILAAGRPYIAAVEDSSEVVAITRRYQCGLLVPPGDPDALVAKILELYHDGPLAAELGQRARRAALDFDRSRQTTKYAALFRDLIGQPEPLAEPKAS